MVSPGQDGVPREVTFLATEKPVSPREGGNSSGKIANRLVALSSAAVLAVYSAGYMRTRAAAERLHAAERARVVIPAVAPIATPVVAQDAATPAEAPVTPATPAPESIAPVAAPPKTPVVTPKATATTATVAATGTPSPAPSPAGTPAATPAQTLVAEPAPTPTPSPSPAPAPAPQWKDGTFSGWGTSRHGDIEATVVIEAGRITNAYISQCWTRYSCSWVAHLQGQVVTRQSPEVDYVSGATQSTNAFYYAVVQALAKAK